MAKDQAERQNGIAKPLNKISPRRKTIWASDYDKGPGVAKDHAEAAKWYRKAAEQNFAAAQYNLGICYAKGEGVAKDQVEAVKWYRKAAEQNLRRGSIQSGRLLRQGRRRDEG